MSRKPIYQHEGRLQPQSVERTFVLVTHHAL